ncbi:MAG: hypothetical protein IPP83_09250 [Flavobacteriales bacterium]|nr:hypothetical protein [Flavobacteriales bacterium]
MTRTTRRWLRVAIAAGGLVVVGFVAQRWLTHVAYAKSVEALANFCGPQSKVTLGAMEVQVLAGDVRWTNVRVEQPADSLFAVDDERAFHIAGTIDTVAVEGLSLLSLLFRGSIVARDLRIERPDLHVILRNDTLAAAATASTERRYTALRLMSVGVERGAVHVSRVGHAVPVLIVQQFDLHAAGAVADFEEGTAPMLMFGTITGELSDVVASLSPLYDLHVACAALTRGGAQLRITDAALRPLVGPENYGKLVPFETDLISMHADTLLASGLDINGSIAQRGLKTTKILMAGMRGEIHRDKTLPDAPYTKKRLPMAGLRNLPFTVDVDNVRLVRWRLHYHERGENGPEYGEVLFSDISAVITGLHTTDTLGGNDVHLVARAKAYDQALITVDAHTSVSAPNERFTLSATIGAMPIAVFNRMTTDLVAIRATAGRINNVNYHITGDDDHATGRVDVSYQDLALSALKRDRSGEENRFKTSVLNLVVRSKNLRSNDGFHHGDFSFDREQDRAVFKYVWAGLREGMLAAMLPGALDDLRKGKKPDARSKR